MKGTESAELLNRKWGCGDCGFENFGWRGTCRHCGKGAPAKWKKAQEAAQKQPKQQAARDIKGKWACGSPRSSTNMQENKALKAELEKLKTQLKELQPAKSSPEDSGFSKQ